MKYLFCLIFIFHALILRGTTTPTLVWSENHESLAGHIRIYEHKNDAKSIAEILHDSITKNWATYPSDYLQLGYKNSYIWLRLDIDFDKIPAEKLYWWFDISVPQDVQFYQIENDSIQNATLRNFARDTRASETPWFYVSRESPTAAGRDRTYHVHCAEGEDTKLDIGVAHCRLSRF